MLETEYFFVKEDGSEEEGRGPFTYVDYDLMDERGVALDICVYSELVDKAKAIVTNRGMLSDRLLVRRAIWFLVSKATRDVLLDLQCCDSIRWIETAIYRKDGTWLADYLLAYGGKRYDVWDYARSDFYWQEGKTPGTKEAAGFMRKGVLNVRSVPAFDLFETDTLDWIGTDRLRDTIEDHGLTGFEFEPIET